MMTSAGIVGEPRGFQYKHGDCPLDGFTIQRAAGRGGFGEVYYAISDGGREVALKLIHTYEQIELRGISHCMNLKSPHLVTIFDVKYGLDGRPWVIMEFVSGPSLRELLDAAPSGLGVPKAAFFLREIAKSLTYLHDCGIVHRDLKPGNIFYENGYVKIGDYGLSKAILGGQNSAQTVTVGTVHYMAPEIGEGHYDKGIDLYALGALLYEMLTGQVPFFGASPAEVLMKHLNAQVDLSAIEEPFATVIRKAMAKNPAERYQSAQEMVEAVFGAEHVRNSVSHFAPESLSMVAGHVARKLPGEPSFAGSSSITNQPERDVLGQLGQRMHRLMNQGVEAAMRPCRRFGRRLDQFMGQPADPRRNENAAPFGRASHGNPHASVRPIDDPVSGPQRRALAAVAIGLAAVGCGLANSDMNSVVGTMFALFATVGGTFGILFGSNRIAPGLPPDQKFLSKLAIGGFGGLCAAIFSAPIVFSHARFSQGLCEAWLAILASLFILDWRHRTKPDRESRVDLGNVVSALILGAILGAIFDRNMTLVAGIVAGIALAVQIACPWDLQAASDRMRQAREEKHASTPVAEMVGAAVAPLEQFSYAGHIPLRPASTDDIAASATPDDMTVSALPSRPVSRFGRAALLFMFVGLATLALFMLGMLIVGSNMVADERAMMFGFAIPSAILAGLCLHRSFATTFTGYWPFFFRPLLQIGCIGSIVVSLSFLTIGRLHHSDAPPAIFFIVFPAVALLVLTFFSHGGGNMSQMTSTVSPSISQGPASDDFFLARVAGGAGRFVASVIGTAILLVATLLALAVVADLPGLANSNLVDARLGNEFRRTFGNADWTRLMRFFGLIASFIFAVVAVAMLMQVRKRSGVLHMLRAPAAAVLLFVFVFLLGRALPAWSELMATENGWELVDQYAKHVANPRVIAAVGPLLVAILLLLWPARRRSAARLAAVQQEGMR
jgi:hypothetical protein